tara:strand:- start:5567 stop:6070 length:504 start_codon:yes stop_codon:yes gene_type:complete
MIIRVAKIQDANKIMLMYKSCVNGMIKSGIDQWDYSYPNIDVITQDINKKNYFVAEINKEIIGGIAIDKNQDREYLNISWINESNRFLVVHRLAVKEDMWNHKIGKKLMVFAEEKAIKNNFHSVRLDTYSGNPKAMNFYKNIGYIELGSINLKPNKNEYYCFEKILS